MKVLLGVSKAIDWFTTLVGRVMFWVAFLMILIGVFNVLTRYIGRAFNVSLGGTLYIALQTYAFDLVFLLAAAYVLKADGHVRVDILFTTLSERSKAWVDIFGTLFFLIPFCLMGLLLSRQYVATSWRQQEHNLNAGGLPIYPIKTVILVGFAMLILQGVSEIIKRIDFLRGGRSDTRHAQITEKTEAI